MKIFIAGATGRVAEELIKELLSLGHQVVAGARSPEKVQIFPGVEARRLDLHADVAVLAQDLAGVDAIYFVAGSRGQDLLQTDVFGAIKLMQAAEQVGINRFIMLSSLFALEPEKWKEPGLDKLTDYNIAKFLADNYLVHQTSLDYTILQPGALLETEATGKVELNPAHVGGNPIPDVATVLAELLELPASHKKIIKMIQGETPIAEALEEL